MAKKKVDVPMMIVTSKVKEFISGNYDKRVAGELVGELNAKVARLLADAVERCESNGRGTVRPGDL